MLPACHPHLTKTGPILAKGVSERDMGRDRRVVSGLPLLFRVVPAHLSWITHVLGLLIVAGGRVSYNRAICGGRTGPHLGGQYVQDSVGYRIWEAGAGMVLGGIGRRGTETGC